jgi:hypothetical protein
MFYREWVLTLRAAHQKQFSFFRAPGYSATTTRQRQYFTNNLHGGRQLEETINQTP